jgi:hypothetical protein
MMRLLVFIVLFINLILSYSIDLWQYSKEGAGYVHNREVYFAYNGTQHVFPDRFTCFAYGFWQPTLYQDLFHLYPLGEPITSMWKSDVPNKHVLALRGNTSDSVRMQTVSRLNGFANAGFLYRPTHNDWLIKITKREKGAPYDQYLGESDFRIVHVKAPNSTTMSKNFSQATQWMEDNIDDYSSIKPSVPYIDLYGADCRLLGMADGRVFLTYATQEKNQPIRPNLVELFFWETDDKVPYLAIQDIVSVSINVPQYPELHSSDQKNWIPFEHDNNVLFVSHIWPLNVLSVFLDVYRSWIGTGVPFNGVWNERSGHSAPWPFGIPHGSTQAVRMQNGEYLAIFHSYKGFAPDEVVQTYVMGAITFSLEPDGSTFSLNSISKLPIILPFMYSGRWYHDTRLWGYVDYALFPVSLMLEGNNVFVMFASQNAHNYIGKMSLHELLGSMKRIKS